VPFTGSHPAAVLFLRWTPLPVSALVIGSVAPDIPYYLPSGPGWPTHTAVAVVTVDALLGALAWVLWHGLLAAPALAVAPAGVRARVVGRVGVGLRRRVGTTREAALVVAALVVGSATHVLWDEFSHPHRWGTDHIPALTETWHGMAGYRWVQYASGVAGAVALAAWLVRWWRRTPPTPSAGEPAAVWIWAVLLVVGATAGGIAALRAETIRAAGFDGATAGGAAMLTAAVLSALVWHVSRSRYGPRRRPS
jgi:hypothetical protein